MVLCSLNVFGCVNGLLRSFVFLFDCDCMGCGERLLRSDNEPQRGDTPA